MGMVTVAGIQPAQPIIKVLHPFIISALLPINALYWKCGSTKHLPGQCSSSAR